MVQNSRGKNKGVGIREAFTQLSDYWHFILGFISGAILRAPYGAILSILIFVVYLLYQARQVEKSTDSYFDYVEYLLGLAFAFIISYL